jgi:hypothetical protein
MSKRRFRTTTTAPHTKPEYPTLETFDRGRREFLTRLGGALLGAGALGSALAACGGRAVGTDPDSGMILGGDPVQPDALVDEPDLPVNMGGALPPPAKKDTGPEWPVDGDPMQPDARVDDSGMEPDSGWETGGIAPPPPAKADLGMDHFIAGGAPQPPAPGDDGGGSCPNP